MEVAGKIFDMGFASALRQLLSYIAARTNQRAAEFDGLEGNCKLKLLESAPLVMGMTWEELNK